MQSKQSRDNTLSRWASEDAGSQSKDSKASKEERNGEKHEEQARQVYVKMVDSKTVVLDVVLSETADEIKRKTRMTTRTSRR